MNLITVKYRLHNKSTFTDEKLLNIIKELKKIDYYHSENTTVHNFLNDFLDELLATQYVKEGVELINYLLSNYFSLDYMFVERLKYNDSVELKCFTPDRTVENSLYDEFIFEILKLLNVYLVLSHRHWENKETLYLHFQMFDNEVFFEEL